MDGGDDRLDHRRFQPRASPVKMDRRVIGERKRLLLGGASKLVQRMLGRVRRRDGHAPSSALALSTICRQTEPIVVTNSI